MIPFRARGEKFVASFEEAEVEILDQLAGEVHQLLDHVAQIDGSSSSGRALGRLLPAAYPDDEESNDEFRRFTSDDLVERKQRNAGVIRASLTGAARVGDRVRVALDAAAAQSWLRGLTDIRLTLAVGLGIEKEGDESAPRAADHYALEIYGWLGFVQESLLDALDI